MNRENISGYHIYYGFLFGLNNIQKQRKYLNKINVFPVADGDTGTNLCMTMATITNRLCPVRSAKTTLNNIANLSLESARGSSGLICSQYLNGLAAHTPDKMLLSLAELAQSAKNAVSLVYEAITNPVEGTILTVLKTWAESIYQSSLSQTPLLQTLAQALVQARNSLDKTKEQLPVLQKNNVFDAGAQGFIYFLEGIAQLNRSDFASLSFRKSFHIDSEYNSEAFAHGPHNLETELKYRYCAEFLVGHAEDSIPQKQLKQELQTIGDSLVLSQGARKNRVHIHTNQPELAYAILQKSGIIYDQKVDDMFRQQQVQQQKIGEIAIVTDSVADIPQDILDNYQIHIISFKLIWGQNEYLDRLTITAEQFYQKQAQSSCFPSSSLPAPANIHSLFQYLLEYYEGIIVLPIAKVQSGFWGQLQQCAKQYNDKAQKIAVVDTCLNSIALGLLVIQIAQAAATEKSLESLIILAENLKKRIKTFVFVPTLKHFIRGGRISRTKGWLASLLNLKPIITLGPNGNGIVYSKAFSYQGLLKKAAHIIKTIHKTNKVQSYGITHAAAQKDASLLANILQGITQKTADYITETSPIVGMHSGKRAIAVGLIKES